MDVAHGPPAKKKPKGSSKWSLDPRLEVSLRVRDASSSTGDQKVSVAGAGVGRVGGGQPVASGLLLTGCPALTPSPRPGRGLYPPPPRVSMTTVVATAASQRTGAKGLRRPGFLFDPSVQQMFTVHLLHARHCRALETQKGLR